MGTLHMNDWSKRVDELDLSLFEAVPSQTTIRDRRSLLAVQRAVAARHNSYVYLEIGSHLGGSLQTHLPDDRCTRIYSIDPRPLQQADDRAANHIAHYRENSTERMLAVLKRAGYGEVSKLACFELDASKLDPRSIADKPQLVFIDGEHTQSAVVSDFQFCLQVIRKDGVILFHDFYVIYPALRAILDQLCAQDRPYMAQKLEDNVFGIFLDVDVVTSDAYLAALQRKYRHFLAAYRSFGFAFHAWRSLKRSIGPTFLASGSACQVADEASRSRH
jgi:predicted O-methyltransferase YrrM